jgi:hypothetical protein
MSTSMWSGSMSDTPIRVTHRSRGNSQRTDTELLDELADVAKRLRPNRLADHLEQDGKFHRGEET